MKITVFGATGVVGKHVVTQALGQGHIVTAFTRNIDSLIDQDLANDNLLALKGYIFDEVEVFNAIKGAEGVVSVLGGAIDGRDKARSLGMKNIVTQMKRAGVKRIVALGGMGALNADENTLIIDQADYPEKYLLVGKQHVEAWTYLKESGLDWTFVCASEINDEAAREHFITEINYMPRPGYGTITASDLASFMVSELVKNQFLQLRVGISN